MIIDTRLDRVGAVDAVVGAGSLKMASSHGVATSDIIKGNWVNSRIALNIAPFMMGKRVLQNRWERILDGVKNEC